MGFELSLQDEQSQKSQEKPCRLRSHRGPLTHCPGGLACKTSISTQKATTGMIWVCPQLCTHPRHSLDPQSLAHGLAYGILLVSIHWIISNLLLSRSHKTGTSKTLGFGEPYIRVGLPAEMPHLPCSVQEVNTENSFSSLGGIGALTETLSVDWLPGFIESGELATN